MNLNVNSFGRLVDEQGAPLADSRKLLLRFNEPMTLSFVFPQGTVSPGDAFTLAVDDNFLQGDELVALHETPAIDAEASTVAFAAIPATSRKLYRLTNGVPGLVQAHLQVIRYAGGDETAAQTVVDDTIFLRGVVYVKGATAVLLDPNAAYTKDETDALLSAAPEFQFSADGEAWHSDQAEGDAYLRFRSAFVENAPWSRAVRYLPADIPSELADLADDPLHRLVTDADKANWNSKQSALTAGDNISIVGNTITATVPEGTSSLLGVSVGGTTMTVTDRVASIPLGFYLTIVNGELNIDTVLMDAYIQDVVSSMGLPDTYTVSEMISTATVGMATTATVSEMLGLATAGMVTAVSSELPQTGEDDRGYWYFGASSTASTAGRLYRYRRPVQTVTVSGEDPDIEAQYHLEGVYTLDEATGKFVKGDCRLEWDGMLWSLIKEGVPDTWINMSMAEDNPSGLYEQYTPVYNSLTVSPVSVTPGGYEDITPYATSAELAGKQDALTPGENVQIVGSTISVPDAITGLIVNGRTAPVAGGTASVVVPISGGTVTNDSITITDGGTNTTFLGMGTFSATGYAEIGKGLRQRVAEIPAATTACTLSEGCYTHTPSSAPTYTLPSMAADGLTHEVVITVKFTDTQALTFQDTNGYTITPQSTPTIAATSVICYLCRWSPLAGAWKIYPVVEVE